MGCHFEILSQISTCEDLFIAASVEASMNHEPLLIRLKKINVINHKVMQRQTIK
jgi:hypothetical protein